MKNNESDKQYELLLESLKTLDLNFVFTLKELKNNYRALLKKWHPDKNSNDIEKSKFETMKIISSYETLMDYIENYKFNLSNNPKNLKINTMEWWKEKYGNDGIWS
jgi:DnaJ-class molecular chaperone